MNVANFFFFFFFLFFFDFLLLCACGVEVIDRKGIDSVDVGRFNIGFRPPLGFASVNRGKVFAVHDALAGGNGVDGGNVVDHGRPVRKFQIRHGHDFIPAVADREGKIHVHEAFALLRFSYGRGFIAKFNFRAIVAIHVHAIYERWGQFG